MGRKGINWVICAAGAGTRFRSLGIPNAKPLITLHGQTFLEKSLESIDFHPEDHLILIVQSKDRVRERMQSFLKLKYPDLDILWLELHELSRGQLESYYLARNLLSESKPSAIFNCDTFFKSVEFVEQLEDENIDALVPCGKMDGDSWSFFKLDDEGIVCEVKEKERISEQASVGMYYFSDTPLLLSYCRELLESKNESELYVSSIYEYYIRDSKRVLVSSVDEFLPFGSLEQLRQSWGISTENLVEMNKSDV